MFTKKVTHEKFKDIILLLLKAIEKVENRIRNTEEYLERYNKISETIEKGDEIVINELFRRIDMLADIAGFEYDEEKGNYIKKTLKKKKK